MKIRTAKIKDLESVINLMNLTSKHLIEKNVYQWSYPCCNRDIKEDIKKGELYILSEKNKIIGSYSIKDLEEKFYIESEEGLYLYRIAIDPKYQGKNIGNEIIKHLRNKKKEIFFDCWAGNNKLKEFYLKNGCQLLGDYPEETYKISVFKV